MANVNQQLRQQETELVKLRMQARYFERSLQTAQSWRGRLINGVLATAVSALPAYAVTSRLDQAVLLPALGITVYIVITQVRQILANRRG